MAVLLLIFDRNSIVGSKVCDAVECLGRFWSQMHGGVAPVRDTAVSFPMGQKMPYRNFPRALILTSTSVLRWSACWREAAENTDNFCLLGVCGRSGSKVARSLPDPQQTFSILIDECMPYRSYERDDIV